MISCFIADTADTISCFHMDITNTVNAETEKKEIFFRCSIRIFGFRKAFH